MECRDRQAALHLVMGDMGIQAGESDDFPIVLYLLTNQISLSTKKFSYLQ